MIKANVRDTHAQCAENPDHLVHHSRIRPTCFITLGIISQAEITKKFRSYLKLWFGASICFGLKPSEFAESWIEYLARSLSTLPKWGPTKHPISHVSRSTLYLSNLFFNPETLKILKSHWPHILSTFKTGLSFWVLVHFDTLLRDWQWYTSVLW